MTAESSPRFWASHNVALKLPVDRPDETVTFYGDILRLPVYEPEEGTWVEFGPIRLWLDPTSQRALPEVWLEVVTDDLDAAASYLAQRGVPRRDAVEPLPDGLPGFWISSPAGVIHLVCESRQN